MWYSSNKHSKRFSCEFMHDMRSVTQLKSQSRKLKQRLQINTYVNLNSKSPLNMLLNLKYFIQLWKLCHKTTDDIVRSDRCTKPITTPDVSLLVFRFSRKYVCWCNRSFRFSNFSSRFNHFIPLICYWAWLSNAC